MELDEPDERDDIGQLAVTIAETFGKRTDADALREILERFSEIERAKAREDAFRRGAVHALHQLANEIERSPDLKRCIRIANIYCNTVSDARNVRSRDARFDLAALMKEARREADGKREAVPPPA